MVLPLFVWKDILCVSLSTAKKPHAVLLASRRVGCQKDYNRMKFLRSVFIPTG